MKNIDKEAGYSLFIVILTVFLFGILSISLLTVSISGAKRSEIREDVTQATELSDKGLQHITQQLDKELTDALGANGLSRSEFIQTLNNTLHKYRCAQDGHIHLPANAETGEYEVCIEEINPIFNDKGQQNELKHSVKVRSKGIVDGQTKEIISTIEVGSGSVPEVLKYAVGTNIRSNNPKNGEGNLLLHGGVDIHGDVRVDGNLVTYERGVGAYQWINSIQPRMHSLTSGTDPRIVVGKNMYKMNSDPYHNGTERDHNRYLNNNNFRSGTYSLQTDTQPLFDDEFAPTLINREPKKDNINITGQKGNFYFNRRTPGVTSVNIGSNQRFNGYGEDHKKIVPYVRTCGIYCTNHFDALTSFYNTNTFNALALGGRGHIRYGTHIFKDGLYVEGNLTIGNGKETDNPNNRDNITIDGPIYVKGDLFIHGANLTSNAMIYVEGNVSIRYSSIQGKRLPNNETGTLIVFSKGDIFLANNSVRQDNPTHIKGYFYSEGNIETYGVGSNIHIDGGIAANRVVLNAIRGKVRSDYFRNHGGLINGVGYVDNIDQQHQSNSRLTIKYDPELVENYLKLNPPEPVINSIDPIDLIDREVN